MNEASQKEEKEFFPETAELNRKLNEMSRFNLDTMTYGRRPFVRSDY